MPTNAPRTETLSLADLAAFPLFVDLDTNEIKRFLQTAKIRSYNDDDIICKEGEEADGLYLLIEGEVEVVKGDAIGGRHLICTLREGEFFGEMALLENKPRSASVLARSAVKVIFLGRGEFSGIPQDQAQILNKVLLRMMADMSFRLRSMGERYVSARTCMAAFQSL